MVVGGSFLHLLLLVLDVKVMLSEVVSMSHLSMHQRVMNESDRVR